MIPIVQALLRAARGLINGTILLLINAVALFR